MKHWMRYAMAAAVLCAGMLTACGNDSVDQKAEISAETTSAETGTTAAETTAETTETTAETNTTETTAESEGTDETATETTAAAEADEPSDEQEQPGDVYEDTPEQEIEQPIQEPQQEEPQQEIIWDVLRVNGSVANYLSNHTDYSFEEADSCMGDGKDRVYTYADRVLMTYYENGSEILIELDILAPGIVTRKGIGIGSSVGDLEASYGGPDAMGMYLFQTEDGTLEFVTDGSTVTFIALYE